MKLVKNPSITGKFIFVLFLITVNLVYPEAITLSPPEAKKLASEAAVLTAKGAIHTALYGERVMPEIEGYRKDGDKQHLLKVKAYVQGVIDLWIASGREASKMTRPEPGRTGHPIDLRPEFFHRAPMMESFLVMREAGILEESFQKEFQGLVENHFTIEERGPNNRAASFSSGCALAAKAFPTSVHAKEWNDYAEAVWQDWYAPGDTYEPCYILHHRRLIELGQILGKTEELRGEKLRKTYDRYLCEISPSGLAVSAGDGITFDSISYFKVFESIMEVCPTPEYLWGMKATFLWQPGSTEENFYKKYPQYKTMEVRPPHGSALVSYRWPATFPQAERITLCPSWEKGNPFASFWLNDSSNYLYHGGVGDSRGDLIHYEVGGVLLVADRGRYDWPAWNNTFVVGEPDGEYPFVREKGVHEGRWYRGSGDIRNLRVFSPSQNYVTGNNRGSKEIKSDQILFKEVLRPIGFMYGNPDAIADKNNQIPINSASIEFAVVPPEGEKSGKIFPNRTWWGGYESRNVCPSSIPVDLFIRDLAIAGSKGEETLISLDKIPEGMEVTIIPPKSSKEGDFSPVKISGEEVSKLVRIEKDPETGKNAMRITTQAGRIRLDFKLPGKVYELKNEYTRINLSYKYLTPIQKWSRTPIRLYLNGSDLHGGLMIDGQQGGILTDSSATTKAGDSFGTVSYKAIWTYDSSWRRSMVMTKEGILVVRDEFHPGTSASQFVGGPVWHLPRSPQTGSIPDKSPQKEAVWFDSNMMPENLARKGYEDSRGAEETNLFIAISSSEERESGVQFQPKHWESNDYAVFSKSKLTGGRPIVFTSVFIPHSTKMNPTQIVGSKNEGGLTVHTGAEGSSVVIVNSQNSSFPYPSMTIEIDAKGKWKVERNPASSSK